MNFNFSPDFSFNVGETTSRYITDKFDVQARVREGWGEEHIAWGGEVSELRLVDAILGGKAGIYKLVGEVLARLVRETGGIVRDIGEDVKNAIVEFAEAVIKRGSIGENRIVIRNFGVKAGIAEYTGHNQVKVLGSGWNDISVTKAFQPYIGIKLEFFHQPPITAPTLNWRLLPGFANDIGVGANWHVWIIGTNPVGGGFGIYNWTGNNWQAIDGGAVRIDVAPDGKPWVINDRGQIFRRQGNSWEVLPGSARDIGIGANGDVWVIGTNQVPGGFGIYHWDGTNWHGIDGGAVRIDVAPDGKPWVINDRGQIFRRQGNSWEVLPGAARDIGIGRTGDVWVIGVNAVPGGFGTYRWNGNNWDYHPGGALNISVDPNGKPWVTNSVNQIFTAQ